MAKRGQPSEDGTEQVKSSEVVKRINASALKKLMSTMRNEQDEIDEHKGAMGGAVNAAVEKYGLNKKMFGWIRWLNKQSPEKLAMHLDDFDHMLDISGLNERAESAPRLQMDGTKAGDHDGAEDENTEGGSTVTKFPAPQGAASA